MIRINLLPVRAVRRKENIRRQVSAFLLSVFLLIISMYYLNSKLENRISELDDQIRAARKELASYRKLEREMNRLKKDVETYKKKLKVIKSLQTNRGTAVRIMDAITQVIVAHKMWLTSFSQKGKAIKFTGIAMDNETIANFMKRLEKSEYFTKIELISSRQKLVGKNFKFKDFTITCSLKG
nr:hypothetical protein [Desulfobacterales bacterium]